MFQWRAGRQALELEARPHDGTLRAWATDAGDPITIRTPGRMVAGRVGALALRVEGDPECLVGEAGRPAPVMVAVESVELSFI